MTNEVRLLTYQPRPATQRISDARQRWAKSPDLRDQIRAHQIKMALNCPMASGEYPSFERICKAFEI